MCFEHKRELNMFCILLTYHFFCLAAKELTSHLCLLLMMALCDMCDGPALSCEKKKHLSRLIFLLAFIFFVLSCFILFHSVTILSLSLYCSLTLFGHRHGQTEGVDGTEDRIRVPPWLTECCKMPLGYCYLLENLMKCLLG